MDLEKRSGTTTIILKGDYTADTIELVRSRGFEAIATAKALFEARLSQDRYVSDKMMRELFGRLTTEVMMINKGMIRDYEKEIKSLGEAAQEKLRSLGYGEDEIAENVS